MKKLSLEDNDILKIQEISSDLQGVFKISDLQILLKCKNIATFHNRINRLERIGILQRFCRGVYITPNFSKETLCSTLNPSAYLSIGTVLAKNGLIGTVPEKQIFAIRVGRNRNYISPELIVSHYGISSHLYFGFEKKKGILYADNEKAYIDTLYYLMKGHKFSFDPLSDVDVTQLNRKVFYNYLSKYRNKRFVKFCKGCIDG